MSCQKNDVLLHLFCARRNYQPSKIWGKKAKKNLVKNEMKEADAPQIGQKIFFFHPRLILKNKAHTFQDKL
jgi:hypothetical protein